MGTWGRKIQYFAGTVLMLAVAAFVLVVFSLLGVTDKQDIYLNRYSDWSYEILTKDGITEFEPDFETDMHFWLPVGTRAVRITRVMVEDFPGAQLEWNCINPVEVFIDGELLYSDFPQIERSGDGFVRPGDEDWERFITAIGDGVRTVRMSLPVDYLGRELSFITYFPQNGDASIYPEFPSIGNEETKFATFVVFPVRFHAIMTIYALLALMMVGIFLLDLRNGGSGGTLLLLGLYFLMLFIKEAFYSSAGYYSIISSRLNLSFLCWTYMAPLYLYMALRLKGRWRWPIFGGITIWAVYDVTQRYIDMTRNAPGVADTIGPGALVWFLAVAAASLAEGLRRKRWSKSDKKLMLGYGLSAAVITAVYLTDRAYVWGGLRNYLVDGVWMAISTTGNYGPAITLITSITSFVVLIVVITETVRRTVQTLRTVDVLRERSRLTMESYHHMEQSLNNTDLMRHEWKNQVVALQLLAEQKNYDKLEQNLEQMSDRLKRLSVVQYSANFTVNVILQSAAARAGELGVAFTAFAPLPEKLGIDEVDLCSLLINLLDNALEAASKASGPRRVSVSLKVSHNFFAVKCENTYSGQLIQGEGGGFDSTKPSPEEHGWGIKQMRQVAKKYNGILDISYTENSFVAQTALTMRPLTE